MIIGICGAAGAGKDTVAMRLANAHGFRRIAFADPLYEMLEVFTGMHEELLRDRVTKEAVIGWIGKSPRHLLQTLGTEWGRKHVADDIWIKIAIQRARQTANVTIPDVRFDNEAKAIRDAGGSVWLVERPVTSCLDSAAAAHASERGIAGELIDSVIANDGDLALLNDRVDSAVAKATIRYNG